MQKQLTTREREQLESFIHSAIFKYGAQNIAGVFLDLMENVNYGTKWEVKRVLMDKDLNPLFDDLRDDFRDLDTREGYKIVKIDNMEKASKFQEFMQSLSPYYNEQVNLNLL